MKINKAKLLETFFKLLTDMAQNPIAAATRPVGKTKVGERFFIFTLGVEVVPEEEFTKCLE